jgi:hypothetical protein
MVHAFLLFAAVAIDTPTVRVEIDSSKHQMTVVVGPFVMPAMPEMAMGGHDMKGHYTPLYRFDWPIDGWVRGFDVELYDSTGQRLNRRLLHHITLLNFDRRQLISPYVERLFAFGSETKSLMVPKTVGVPMTSGFHMGMYMAWNNTSEVDIAGAYLHLRLFWMPSNMNPAPASVLPLALETRAGQSGPYNAAPGVSTRSFEFTLPASGRIVGAGGHLHDYGKFLELVDLESGKTILHLEAKDDSTGRIHGVKRVMPGIYGRGIHLSANRRYRVSATYDNPTGQTLIRGAMGAIGVAFVPDDLAQWPRVEPSDTAWQRDVAWMEALRDKYAAAKPAEGMQHEGHNHSDQ